MKSGISSLKPFGSMTAPDRMCAPTVAPFSITAISISPSVLPGLSPLVTRSLWLVISRDRWSAPLRFAGPAPTNRTSNSSFSRCTSRPLSSGLVEAWLATIMNSHSFYGSIANALPVYKSKFCVLSAKFSFSHLNGGV